LARREDGYGVVCQEVEMFHVSGHKKGRITGKRHFRKRQIIAVRQAGQLYSGDRRSDDMSAGQAQEGQKGSHVCSVELESGARQNITVLGKNSVVKQDLDFAGQNEIDDAAGRAVGFE
ncbi:hypothetical protein RY27_02860, partial [Litorilinea aerophila]